MEKEKFIKMVKLELFNGIWARKLKKNEDNIYI